MIFVYFFLYFPIFILIAYSFNNSAFSSDWKGFTFIWYKKLFSMNFLLESAGNSLLTAFLSSTLATILGTLSAIALYRYPFFGKKLLYALIYVLMMLPEIVMAISFLVLFLLLQIKLGFLTLLLSHITFCLPFVIITIFTRLSGFDKHLIEAAQDLGANEYQIFRYILLPLLMPAVISGWLLSFTLSMDDVIISFFVTGPSFEILPLKIYSMVKRGVTPEVNALCTILFILTLLLVALSQWLVKEKNNS
jgi:spermidine/putrescine transport system permease protein